MIFLENDNERKFCAGRLLFGGNDLRDEIKAAPLLLFPKRSIAVSYYNIDSRKIIKNQYLDKCKRYQPI
jgi:hypothetical protein